MFDDGSYAWLSGDVRKKLLNFFEGENFNFFLLTNDSIN